MTHFTLGKICHCPESNWILSHLYRLHYKIWIHSRSIKVGLLAMLLPVPSLSFFSHYTICPYALIKWSWLNRNREKRTHTMRKIVEESWFEFASGIIDSYSCTLSTCFSFHVKFSLICIRVVINFYPYLTLEDYIKREYLPCLSLP